MWGDVKLPATLTVTQRLADGTAAEVQSGGALYLQVPPQGGHIAYVGAKVNNFEGCRVDLHAELFSPDAGGGAEVEEKRSVDLTVAGMSDPSDPANFANVPVCPDFGPRDFVGTTFRLHVTVTQRDGRAVEASLPVVPSCAVGGPDCECECRAGYEFGKCGRDGG